MSPKGFIFVFVALFGVFGGITPVFSASPFTEDFEACPVGALGLCANWLYTGSYVQTSTVHGGSNAVETMGTNGDFREGDHVAVGDWYFWVKLPSAPVDAGLTCIQFQAHYSLQQQMCFQWNSGTSKYDVGDYGMTHTLLTDVTPDEWHAMGLSWTTSIIAYSLDGGDYSEPVNLYNPGEGYISAVKLTQGVTSNRRIFIDDFTDVAPPPPTIEGFDPIITPSQPPNGENTTVDFDNFNLAGNISIPSSNTYIWQKLFVHFQKINGVESADTEITLPDLAGGDSYNYTATSTIPAATSTDVYSVSYSAWGYWCDPLYPEYCGKLGLSFPYNPAGTYISEGTNPAGGIPLVNVGQWTPPTLEDCDDPSYNFLEKTTCKIQNSLLGLVIPSAESVNNLFGTFQQFQNRFPFSYVNAIGTTLNTIRTGLNESETISIKVFGQSGNVSLAFWNTSTTIGGVSTTIGAVIKLILTFFVYVIFLIWGIGYLHRIL